MTSELPGCTLPFPVVPYLRMGAALGLCNTCGEVHATKNGVSIGEDGGGREEEDVSYGDTEFNHSHTIAKPAVSDLLKTVLCLLKNVSDFVPRNPPQTQAVYSRFKPYALYTTQIQPYALEIALVWASHSGFTLVHPHRPTTWAAAVTGLTTATVSPHPQIYGCFLSRAGMNAARRFSPSGLETCVELFGFATQTSTPTLD
ncbi:hypothetical protein B0H14DRAFT_2645287 [Mycena olivaceomarginata]|nr:hypothetical protein B0H14DRAFT_2645287 [Mycena olivaceomarginata]